MYLTKRHQTWWALHDVPTDLQHALGKRLSRSLRTGSKTEAERLASLLWLHDWSRRIKTAKAARRGGDDAEAALFRELIRNAKSDEERELLRDHVADIARDRSERAKTATEQAAAFRFNKAAQGKLTPTADHIDEYLESIDDTPKTKAMKRSALTALAAALPYAQEVDTVAAQGWLAETVKAGSLSAKTADRILSFVRGYWRFLKSQGVVDTEPFIGLAMPTTRKAPARKAFTAAQVVALHARAVASKDQELADLIELGMWTGARIEELCSLEVLQVDLKGRAFTIKDAKTAAGVREVPVHDSLMPTLRRLIEGRKDGYVLADLTPNKFGDKSNAIGKRFGRLKGAAGFGAEHVFHSIRKTVVTLLENAGVSENIAADIVGHEKPRITYGLYSGGSTLETKREALEMLRYPLPGGL